MWFRFLLALWLVLGAGCSAVVSPDESRLGGEGGGVDAGPRPDGGGGGVDAGTVDGGGGGICTPGTTDRIACGDRCGTAPRTCTAAGTWEIGECRDEGACAPGASVRVACGTGEIEATCTATCEIPTLACPLDVVLLLDITGSHNSTIAENDEALVEHVVRPLLAAGDVRVGVAAFADFPYSPFGRSSDRPFIGRLAPTADAAEVGRALANLPSMNGNDLPESGMEALFVLAGGSPHETSLPLDCPDGTEHGGCWRPNAERAVVLVTDVAQHNAPSPLVDGLLAPYPGWLGAPGWNEVRPRMEEAGITLFGLVRNRGETEADGSRQLRMLVQQLGDTPAETLVIYTSPSEVPPLDMEIMRLGGLLTTRYFGR